ncbi:MAG: PspC domain-containing protein [Anaerolineales bacterium]|nr:MAG: PspC domain-containing protein [Anaerolineales bacterium]
MKNLVLITLSGHSASFKAEQDAYDALRQYLDRAKRSLQADPDHEEVLRDLEQSIGEKLAARLASAEQVLTLADIKAVLAEVGPVAGDSGTHTPPKGRRRLVRIQEGQDILGICQGLSAYSDIDVDWIRTIFVGLALVTGGAFILVYFAAAFFLPVVATREEYFARYGSNLL